MANEVESFRTASSHVFAGYATPRDTVPDDNAYILLLRRHLTSAHTCLQRAKLLVDEYEHAYADAVAYAGIQVWASMQRHAGDPCWEWCHSEVYGGVERRT